MIYAFIYILIGYLFARTKLVTETVDEELRKHDLKPNIMLWICIILLGPIVLVSGVLKAFATIIKRRKTK